MSDADDSFALHMRNLDRCGDKQQRDAYLDGVERNTNKEYRQAIQLAWFHDHTAKVDYMTTQLANTPLKTRRV